MCRQLPSKPLQKGWVTVNINNWVLAYDPRRKLYSHKNGNSSIHLLGFAIDVTRPHDTEEDIIQRIDQTQDVLDVIDDLCGVFMVICANEEDVLIYHDATSALKVFYKKDMSNNVEAIGFDPLLLDHYFECNKDMSAKAADFYNLKKFQLHAIKLGDRTSYSDVFQLLPNRNLSLSKGIVRRIFPRQKLMSISSQDAVKSVSNYFKTVIEASARKFKSRKMTITAGWDSKVLLSCTKDQKDIEYYLFLKSNLDDDDVDIQIAQQISDEHELSFSLFNAKNESDSAARANFVNSFSQMGNQNLKMSTSGIGNFDPDDILILGYISEITKNFYEGFDIGHDERRFCYAAKLPDHDYCKNYFKDYLSDHRSAIERYNYDFNDIAHWEQDITNFAASRLSIYNTYLNAISPFNCRRVISTILSVDSKLRGAFTNIFFRDFIEYNWPELNNYPINPGQSKLRVTIKKKLGIYNLIKEWNYKKYKKQKGAYVKYAKKSDPIK